MRQLFKSQKFIVTFSFAILVILLAFLYVRNTPKPIDMRMYEDLLLHKNIIKAKIQGSHIILETTSGNYTIIKDAVDVGELLKDVPIQSDDERGRGDESEAFMLFIFIAFLLIFFLTRRKNQKVQTSQTAQKSKAQEEVSATQKITPVTSNISFKDVAGIRSVKEELTEIVDFLKHPKKYKEYGITLPKGVLLVGPPGVGKTMVAKAIAGEANVPFFYQSGASFVQIYVGMGAKRVRELFSKAKAYAPSIVFIDEIDAVGKARGGMRNDEREATLNQLLTEIDGFEDSSGVIVIAATNRIEMIDEALLRSGRFDRRIFLPLPDLKDRADILKIYLANKSCDVDEKSIAKMTVGFSGAALSTLVNEAAINALRHGSKKVTLDDFISVRDKVLLGKRKILIFNDNEKKIQATYQGAKALSAFWFDVDFDKIMILGGGLKETDKEIESKNQMFSKIKVFLAGVAASDMVYHETFTNAKDDISKAREIATLMAEHYGMGDSLIPLGHDVNHILDSALKEVREFLEGVQKQLQQVESRLIENETISKSEIKSIMNESF